MVVFKTKILVTNRHMLTKQREEIAELCSGIRSLGQDKVIWLSNLERSSFRKIPFGELKH